MLRRLTLTGAAGALLVAASSWRAGAVPLSFRSRPPALVAWNDLGGAVPRIAYYAGLAALVASWLVLGRHVLKSPAEVDRRGLTLLAISWALPLMAAMPVASRDLWAYAAQGNLEHRGFDPYVATPAQLPGVFADNVSNRWINSTSPYGPLWLLIGRRVAALSGGHVQLTVFVLRLPALLGLLMMIWALPRIAERIGRRADVALWLAAASPLALVMGLGGGHNDLLMAGVMTLGALAAVSPGSALHTLGAAAALTAAATAVKSPALIAVAFVVPLWLRYGDRPRRPQSVRRVVTAASVAATCAVVTFTLISMAGQHGLGWVKQTNVDAQANWISLPTSAAMFVKLVSGHTTGTTSVDDSMRYWRTGGVVLAAVLIAVLWLLATRDAIGHKQRRLDVMTALAAAMTLIVLLGPTVQPWYFGWALPFAALCVLPARTGGALVAATVALVLIVRPEGRGVQMQPVVLAVLAVGAALGWLTVRRSTSVPGDDHADSARAGVRADGRPDL